MFGTSDPRIPISIKNKNLPDFGLLKKHPDTQALPNLFSCHDRYSQPFEASGSLPPWYLHELEIYHDISSTGAK